MAERTSLFPTHKEAATRTESTIRFREKKASTITKIGLKKQTSKLWSQLRFFQKIAGRLGCCLAQLVVQASHVQRLCPHCSDPGFESRPSVLCCMSLLSLILFSVISWACTINKAIKKQKADSLNKIDRKQVCFLCCIHLYFNHL